MKSKTSRRHFLKFLGRTGVLVGTSAWLGGLAACGNAGTKDNANNTDENDKPKPYPMVAIPPSTDDQLLLSKGLEYQVLISWGDAISEKDHFGFNNDYLAYIPLDENNPDDGLLWANHEYLSPMFVSGFIGRGSKGKTQEQVDKEMYSVGGTIVRVKKEGNKWNIVQSDKHNRRFTAKTVIPFHWDEPIAGATEAVGTFAGCSGGVTPWGTIFSCEENYDAYYGETDYSGDQPKRIPSSLGWENFEDQPPEHYGWVVEVNPKTGEARKLVALGRCAHECATMFRAPDGRLVVYTGDDSNDEHLYKFVSDAPDDLKNGTLYVANTEKGEWISLKYDDQPVLQEKFKNQTEVLIRVREAAKLVGATPLNRPEDIEIDPLTGNVLVALTNNKPKDDYLGQIMKIEEDTEDKTGTTFKASTFLAGGEELGFACPDNMAFDKKGNLWFTSDISGSSIGKDPYIPYGNNGLYLVPAHGEQAGEVLQIASAPKDAEFTGPFFAPDGKTLFLSVQHPGETSPNMEELTSNWPVGGNEMPKPSVVAISGTALDELMTIG